MDLVLQAAQALGKTLQQDNRYLAYQLALQASEEDADLAQKIHLFEEQREQLTQAAKEESKDPVFLSTLDESVELLYNQVMVDPTFVAFTAAQQQMRLLLGQVNQIIKGSSEGENPEQIDPTDESAIGGCGGCSGCH